MCFARLLNSTCFGELGHVDRPLMVRHHGIQVLQVVWRLVGTWVTAHFLGLDIAYHPEADVDADQEAHGEDSYQNRRHPLGRVEDS